MRNDDTLTPDEACDLLIDAKTREEVESIVRNAGGINWPLYAEEPTEFVRLVYTSEDVLEWANDCDPPVHPDLALERAEEWGKHVQDTAANLISEQLCSAVTTGGV